MRMKDEMVPKKSFKRIHRREKISWKAPRKMGG
jgi:hypothetical protein